jgi:hypothetical protein
MDTRTRAALAAIGVDSAKAETGVTYGPSGTHYSVKELFLDANGIKVFRVYANGQLKLRAQEQVQAIFC